MDELGWVLVAIGVVAGVTYLTRLGGWFIGARLAPGSTAHGLFEALPGCALAAVVATSALLTLWAGLVAVMTTGGLYLWSGRALPAMLAGVAITVAGAHLG